MVKRSLEQPLQFQIAPGVVAAHAGQTVVILGLIGGDQVRVRDVKTGTASGASVVEQIDDLYGTATSPKTASIGLSAPIETLST